MNIVYFLLPLALMLAGVFVAGFIYATRKGQYDDLETPAHRMLLDEEKVKEKSTSVLQERNIT